MAIAPYSRTERRPTRSTVKYSGTQPRVKKIFRTPDNNETRDGFATVERMTLPVQCQSLPMSEVRMVFTVVCDETGAHPLACGILRSAMVLVERTTPIAVLTVAAGNPRAFACQTV